MKTKKLKFAKLINNSNEHKQQELFYYSISISSVLDINYYNSLSSSAERNYKFLFEY